MDREKILFCYREDKFKNPVILESNSPEKMVAAIPVCYTFFRRHRNKKMQTVKRQIAKCYEESGASYLWLSDELCEYLKMEKMELPGCLIEKWLLGIPFYQTLILADDASGRMMDYLYQKTDRIAALCIVCHGKYEEAYEKVASVLYQKEGLFLQVISYEKLRENPDFLTKELVIKGRAAILDLADEKAFWLGMAPEDIRYHSFYAENRLFLDTCKKNSYNTLTK